MRPSLALALAATLVLPAAAHAAGMECIPTQGGRAICVESRDAILDRLSDQARDDQTARQRRLARAIAEAVKAGRCDEAQALARQGREPQYAANAARICPPSAAANTRRSTTPQGADAALKAARCANTRLTSAMLSAPALVKHKSRTNSFRSVPLPLPTSRR